MSGVSDPTRQIGSYTLIRVLGEGGMGIVHLAQDGDFKLVAVKELRPELAARPDFLRRFTREAAAARKVARFCTAPVLDAGIDGKTAYIVTDYVEGPDLRSVVKEQGPLSGANLEALAVGVATALTAIHEAGVVHRDLKPANILLSPVGPRVIDFGIAQLAEPEVTRSATIMDTGIHVPGAGQGRAGHRGERRVRLGRRGRLCGHGATTVRHRPHAGGAVPRGPPCARPEGRG